MKGLKEHVMLLAGGAFICMMVVSFLGFLFQMGSKLEDVFGSGGFFVIVTISYAVGWIFFKKLDERVRKNVRPHMIHYHIDNTKKR